MRRKLITGDTISIHCGCKGSAERVNETYDSSDNLLSEANWEYCFGYNRLEGLVTPTPSRCPKCGLHRWVLKSDYETLMKAVRKEEEKSHA